MLLASGGGKKKKQTKKLEKRYEAVLTLHTIGGKAKLSLWILGRAQKRTGLATYGTI